MMTDTRQVTKPKYIIFLGAGASCSEHAPSQSQLFQKAFQSNCHNRIDPDGHLKKYFKKFWSIDVEQDDLNSVVFPTFEEALGMLELARNRQEAFKGFYSNANKNNIDHIIEDLIYLMAEVLKETLTISNKYHMKLIDHLKHGGLLSQCCFVSLNYDILIDNALITARDVCDMDYGVDFMNFEYKSRYDYENWDRPNYKRSVKLLKLHGSLNWLYCPVCNKIKITPKSKTVVKLAYIEKDEECRCDICKGRFAPILIPPTYYKNMANYYIASIWAQAEQAIMGCEKILFCGYSLPDADMHIKYLLKRGMMNRNYEAPNIVIINNYFGKDTIERDAEKTRYQRLFGKKVKYTRKSFAKFADNPIDLI